MAQQDAAHPASPTEVEALRRRVVELTQELEEQGMFFYLSLDLLCIAGLDGYFKQMNPTWERVLGFTIEELMAKPFMDIVHSGDHAVTLTEVERLAASGSTIRLENRCRCQDGSYRWISWNATRIPDQPTFYAAGRDITEQRRTEEALCRSTAQEARLHAQATALAALSTPLIPIRDEVVVMPLIGAMDAPRVAKVLDTLLRGIAEHHAEVAILDITGVPAADTFVAGAIVHAAKAARLLGAEVVLTGICPQVAQALIELDANLDGIVTCGSLQSGIVHATARLSRNAS